MGHNFSPADALMTAGEIQKTKRRVARGYTQIRTFLDSLGIPYRPGRAFWQLNRAQLPELWRALLEKGRERMVELHPDKGGDTRSFQDFSARFTKAKAAFQWQMGRSKPPEASTTVAVIKTADQIQRRLAAARERWKKSYAIKRLDPDYRAARVATAAKWNKKNPAKRALYSARWQAGHRENLAVARRRYEQSAKGKAAIARGKAKRKWINAKVSENLKRWKAAQDAALGTAAEPRN